MFDALRILLYSDQDIDMSCNTDIPTLQDHMDLSTLLSILVHATSLLFLSTLQAEEHQSLPALGQSAHHTHSSVALLMKLSSCQVDGTANL